ncbi:MAG: integrase core domain-containing protein, partial [Acidimicrobiia bacterium]
VHVMSDNGICFTARLQGGGETGFEANLRLLGISHIPSSPGHPQTCGKLERFHQTLKRWLRTQPLASTLPELQAQLDWFLAYYNGERPHRALDGDTPLERWRATPPGKPQGTVSELPPRASLHQVDKDGSCSWGNYRIGLGQQYRHQTVLVLSRGDHLLVFGEKGLIRELDLDPTRRYQPTGRPPGRRPKTIGPCS